MSVAVSRLANGITVASHHMPHLQSAALGFWVGAGARSETASEHGISHLLEHMAFKGTKRRSAREIAESIEAVGGEVNAATSVDHTSYYVRVLKDDIALGLEILGDIICDPLLDPNELALEQHVVLQEIGAAYDMPEDWVFDMFQTAAFPDQAIGRNILGTPETIRSHTVDDLRRFLDTHYCGPGAVIVAAGNVDHEEVVRLSAEYFGLLPDHSAKAYEPGTYRGGERREARPLQEAQLLLGLAAPSFLHPSFATAHVFSAILGGGMASRLFQELRESRGLCYSIYSFYSPFADTGLFGVQTASSEDDVEKLLPLILDELKKMTDGVTPAELSRAKAQLRAGLLMTLESPLARAGQMARHILVYGRPLTLEETVGKVDAVENADLIALAEAMLSSSPTLAAIGRLNGLPAVDDIAAQMHPSGARLV
jgi:predicted Zn-dependent peptidase